MTHDTAAGADGASYATHPARRLWAGVEPIHALVYFAPEVEEAAAKAGLKGWFMGYFAGRAAPLGAVGPEAVGAMFFGFAPHKVARALPDAWSFATPREVLDSRLDAVDRALARALPDGADLTRLATLLEHAAASCDFGARPLAAAWSGVRLPEDAHPRLRVWLAATVLREHRGDGHVFTAVDHGLDGLQASVTHAAAGLAPGERLLVSRGWSEQQWERALVDLIGRGVLDTEGNLTEAGAALRTSIEESTNRLASAPIRALGEYAVEETIALATPLARHLIDTDAVPVPNPIGVARP
ncbi:SCO6745 family protein [Yinghuangia sp. YIM S09857]|uniref:SCO6745 family protein n=1 Tax=Yinghuangia sp. YIM S09857 TaxID=3436929 RepID=UPI003F5316E6